MQRVQRHPRYWEHPLNLLLGVFPEPSPGGFTTDAFLKLVRGHSTDEQAHLRAGLSALSTPARGLLCRALSVFHGVFLRHPDYPVLFSVALQKMLRCAAELERSALVSMFLDHEPDQRMELVLKAL